MKPIIALILFLAASVPFVRAQEAGSSNAPATELQGLPPMNVASMNGYDWAVMKKLLVRAAQASGTELKDPLPFHNQRGLTVTIAGPNYTENYRQVLGTQIGILTNSLLAALSPFVNSTSGIHINVIPADRKMSTYPATASLSANALKAAYHSGDTILFLEVWNACINRLQSVPGIDVDAATVNNGNFPWTVKTKWMEARYKLPGFMTREQVTIKLYKWVNGRSLGLSVDSEIQMRRLSSGNWMAFPMDEESMGLIRPTKQETTQDICLFEISKELRN